MGPVAATTMCRLIALVCARACVCVKLAARQHLAATAHIRWVACQRRAHVQCRCPATT